ncbi:MAG TPA: KTSC domain-containing protein [Candidatus Bathyarchaeia archaeon]|nr:KTSC domain-containing protein [Candidatus Bathyarchaeia archaeon]
MDREVVVSVSVRAVGYDVETSTLEIEFCDSSIYQYSGVPEGVFAGFLDSMSLNLEKTDLKYFSEHIKGQYPQKTVRRPRLNLFKGVLDT